MKEMWAVRRHKKNVARLREEGYSAPVENAAISSNATVMYLQLAYEDYKQLEEQMRAFNETTHVSTPGPFYHKSIRLKVNSGFIVEFHGPNVRGMTA
jgi:hypothetical protein